MRFISLVLCVLSLPLFAQKERTLQECESALQQNNLRLLAEELNVNITDAEIIQAKIWDLPQFGFSANLYHPQGAQLFNIGPTKSAQITQLFLLGGKRQKQIDFVKSNKELAQLQYQQLTQDLKSQLRESFYSLFFDQKKLKSLLNQKTYLSSLLKAYQVQTAKGNVALKDEVRLNSLVIALNNDIAQLSNNILAEQNALLVLTGLPDVIQPLLDEEEVGQKLAFQPLLTVDELQKKAIENNADYLSTLKTTESAQLFEGWQKSLNTPDLTGGLQWNQNSGYYQNEINFTLGIPIPLWRQNEGNIKKAQFLTQQSAKNAALKKLTLEANVLTAYQTWKNQYEILENIPQKDMDNLDLVYKGMTGNFSKGNVNLIDFTDFTESYKQTVLQVNEMKKQILISAEELNRLVQVPIF